MCVASHGYGGLGAGTDGGGEWYACGTKPSGLIVHREMPERFRVRGETPMSPDHSAVQVRCSG